MDVNAAASRLTLSKSTLDKMRVRGGGPRFVRLGRTIRYTESDIVAWIDAGRRSSTSNANDNAKEKR